MEEIEVPLEQAQEHIHEAAHHAGGSKWISGVALTSALLAVCAAVAALLAGHHSNEAMIDQIKSSDEWALYQAKGIKAAILGSKMTLLAELGKAATPKDTEKLNQYQDEQVEIKKMAEEEKQSSEKHLIAHQTLAKSVTFFQVAIAIAAISVLMRRRRFWFVSLAFGVLGVFFLIAGLVKSS